MQKLQTVCYDMAIHGIQQRHYWCKWNYRRMLYPICEKCTMLTKSSINWKTPNKARYAIVAYYPYNCTPRCPQNR